MSKSRSLGFGQRPARERRLLAAAALLLVSALLWLTTLAPAFKSYRASSAAHAKLDAELMKMQSMAQEAKQLKAMPSNAAAAESWLGESIKKLGKTSISKEENRTQITFTGVSAAALAGWLVDARVNGQLMLTQANWRRAASAPNAPATSKNDALWDGTMSLELPAK